jgi:hypothetical protein
MPRLYVASPAEADWHILRPGERRLVWCRADPDGPTWTRLTLHVPGSVCPLCREAEAASLAAEVDRVPELPAVSRWGGAALGPG